MTYYRTVGDVPRKRHSLHRVDGDVVAEEMVGEEGFTGPSSLLYHRHSPSAIVSIEEADIEVPTFTANQPVAPLPPAHHEVAGRNRRCGHVEDGAARQRRRAAVLRHGHDDEPAVSQRRW